MDGYDEALSEQMTHEEILRRFKTTFGREMSPAERQIFFVPPKPDTPSPQAG
jgi:hypothetical protein